jgi:TP901 family phage tail tape measure protein
MAKSLITKHIIDAVVRPTLDKGEKETLRTQLSDVFANASNINFNTAETQASLKNLTAMFKAIFSAAGITDINFDEIIKMPPASTFNELGKLAGEQFWNAFNSISDGSKIGNSIAQDLINQKQELQKMRDKAYKQSGILGEYSLVSKIDKGDVKPLSLDELDKRRKGMSYNDYASNLEEAFGDSMYNLEELTRGTKEYKQELVSAYKAAYELYQMRATMDAHPDLVTDKETLKRYNYDTLADKVGGQLGEGIYDKDFGDIIAAQRKAYTQYSNQIAQIDMQLQSIKSSNPEIINEEKTQQGLKSLQEIELAYERILNSKNKIGKQGKNIQEALGFDPATSSEGLRALFNAYTKLPDDSPWEIEYQALLKYVRLYESYLNSDNKNYVNAAKDPKHRELYERLQPMAEGAEMSLRNLLNHKPSKTGKDVVSPEDVSRAERIADAKHKGAEADEKSRKENDAAAAAAEKEKLAKEAAAKAALEKEKTPDKTTTSGTAGNILNNPAFAKMFGKADDKAKEKQAANEGSANAAEREFETVQKTTLELEKQNKLLLYRRVEGNFDPNKISGRSIDALYDQNNKPNIQEALSYGFGGFGDGLYGSVLSAADNLTLTSDKTSFFEFDASGYNLFINKTMEQAESLRMFLLSLQKFVGAGTLLDTSELTDIEDLTRDQLYEKAQKIFKNFGMSKEQFNAWIDNAIKESENIANLFKQGKVPNNYHNFATRFMQSLGYDGVLNVTGDEEYDGNYQGSVIYDPDVNKIKQSVKSFGDKEEFTKHINNAIQAQQKLNDVKNQNPPAKDESGVHNANADALNAEKQAQEGLNDAKNQNQTLQQKIGILKQISAAYIRQDTAQDKYDNAEGEKASFNAEQKLEAAREVVGDFEREYHSAIVSMQDGSKINIPLDEEFAETAQNVLANAKQIQDINLIPRSAEPAIQAYERLQLSMDNVYKRWKDPNTLERAVGHFSQDNINFSKNNLNKYLGTIKELDPNFQYGSQDTYNQAVQMVEKLNELGQRITLDEEANRAVERLQKMGHFKWDDNIGTQWATITKGIRDGTFTTVDQCINKFKELTNITTDKKVFKVVQKPAINALDNEIIAQEKLNATENQNPPAQDDSGVHNTNAEAIEKEVAAETRLSKVRKAVRSLWDSSKRFTLSKTGASNDNVPGDTGVGTGISGSAGTGITAPPQVTNANIPAELQAYEALKGKIAEVTAAINTKNKEFYNEAQIVGQVVGKENAALISLKNNVDAVTAAVQTKTQAFFAEQSAVKRVAQSEAHALGEVEKKVTAVRTALNNIKTGADIGAGLSNISINVNHAQSATQNVGNALATENTLISIKTVLDTINGKIGQVTKGGNAKQSGESTKKTHDDYKTTTKEDYRGSGYFPEKLKTQTMYLAKFRAELMTTNRLTDETDKEIYKLLDSLSKVQNGPDLSRWSEQFKQLRTSVGIDTIFDKSVQKGDAAVYQDLINLQKMRNKLELDYERADEGSSLKQFYQEQLGLMDNVISSQQIINKNDEYEAQLIEIQAKHERELGAIKAKKVDASRAEQLKTLKELVGGYEQLGKLQARYDATGDLKAREEAEQLKRELDAKRRNTKTWTTVGQDNSFDKTRSKAYDKEFLTSYATKEEKEKLTATRQLEKAYESLGKKQAKLKVAKGDNEKQVLEDQIKKLQEIISIKQKSLDIDAALYDGKRVDAYNKELERLNILNAKKQDDANVRDSKKTFNDAIKDAQRQAGFNKSESSANKAVETLVTAGQIQGITPEQQVNLDAYQSKIEALRNTIAAFPKNGVATEAQKNQLIAQRLEVDAYTKEIQELIANYERLSGENAQVIGTSTLGLSANEDAYRQELTQTIMAQTKGRAQIKAYDAETRTLTYTLKTGKGEFTQYTASVRQADGALVSVRGTTTKAMGVFESIGQKLKQYSYYFTGSMMIYRVIAWVREGITAVTEIDKALTELKKVTDETEASYDRFLNTASKTSAKLGTTIADFTQATATFAKLGYEMATASAMAEAATVYQNVGDGIESADDAAESIISTIKGFNLEASESMRIVDRFNEVGNRFSITSKGIGDALQRSASALSAGGNTLDESIGLITAANEVVQDPESVGTALKTLSLRLRGAKTELEEAGLETENMAETTATLQKKLLGLTSGKVDIMLDANTFKNTTEILREMSDAWEDMTDIQRAAALELMGGKRQGNILSSIIQNFDTVESVIETSANSSNSALEENAKWMDSIEGKSKQFANALNTMWNDTLNSDLIKIFIDLGTGLIKMADGIDVFGTKIGNMWTTVGLIIALVVKRITKLSWGEFFTSIGTSITSLNVKIAGLATRFGLMSGAATTANKALENLTAGELRNAMATAGVDKAHREAMLSQMGLTGATKDQIIAQGQLTASTLEEAVANKTLTQTQAEKLAAYYGLKLSTIGLTSANAAHILTEAGVNREQKKRIIAALGLTMETKTLTQEEFINALAAKGVGDANERAAWATLFFGEANKKLTFSFKSLGEGIKNFITKNGVLVTLALIAAAIAGITAIARGLIQTLEESEEKLTELNSALDETAGKLNDLEGQLKEVRDRMKELNEQESLTFVEQEELDKLREKNAELERQISLTKQVRSAQQKEVNDQALKTAQQYKNANFKSGKGQSDYAQDGATYGAIGLGIVGAGAGAVAGSSIIAGSTILGTTIAPGVGTAIGAIIGAIVAAAVGAGVGAGIGAGVAEAQNQVGESMDNMLAERNKLEEKYNKAHEAYATNATEKNAEKYKEAEEALANYDSMMAEHMSKLDSYYSQIDLNIYDPVKDAEKIKLLRKEINDFYDTQDKWAIANGGQDAKNNAITRIFGQNASQELKNIKREIQDAVTAEDWDGNLNLEDYFNPADLEAFTKRLRDIGIYIYEVENYFKDMAEAEKEAAEVSLYGVATDINKITEGLEKLKSAFDEVLESGSVSAKTLTELNDVFGTLGDSWDNYVNTMFSGISSTKEMQEATEELAKAFIDSKILTGEAISEYERMTYIIQLRNMGVENAEEYVDDKIQENAYKAIQNSAAYNKEDVLDYWLGASEDDKKYFKEKLGITKTDFYELSSEELEKIAEYYDMSKEINADIAQKIADEYDLEIDNLNEVIDLLEQKEKAEKKAADAKTSQAKYGEWVNNYNAVAQDANVSNPTTKTAFEIKRVFDDKNLYQDDMPDGWRTGNFWTGYKYHFNDKEYDDYGDFEEAVNTYVAQYSEQYAHYKEAQDKLQELINSEEGKKWLVQNEDGTYRLKDNVDAEYKAAYEAAENGVKELENQIETELTADVKLKLELQEKSKLVDDIQSVYDTLANAQKEYNEKGYFSVDTMQSLLELEPKYLDLLIDENGNLNLNKQALYDVAIARLTDMKLKQQDAILTEAESLAAQGNMMSLMAQVDVMADVGEEYDVLIEKRLESIRTILEERKALADGEKGKLDESFDVDAYINGLKGQLDAVERVSDSAIKNINKSLSSSDSDGKTALEAIQEKYERKLKNLENQQTWIENEIEQLEAEEEGVSASYYEKQIELEEEKIGLYQQEREELLKLKRTDEVADALWEVEHAIQESTLRMIEFRKSIAELYATASERITEAYDRKGQLFDDRKSFIENEISIRETKGELVSTSVYDELIEQEKQKRADAEAELNDQADLYWQGIGDYNKRLGSEGLLKEFGKGGNVDLLNRPQIDTSKLEDAGWEDVGEGIATVFTNTFSNEDGTVAINFTPILPDGSVLSPDELTSYAEGVIAGTREDDLGLQIGSAFNGEDAIQQASNAAEEIHLLQETYYAEGQLDPNSDEALDMLEKIRQKKLEMQESDKQIAEYAEQQKEAYIAYYDKMMEIYSHRNDFFQLQSDFAQSYIDRLETLQINVPDEAYDKMKEIQELSNKGLKEQLAFASSELAKFEENGIDKNDSRYIEKFKEVLDLEKQVYEGETKVLEYHQKIFDNQIDRFNQVIDRINNATQKLQNVSGLLEREDVATEDGKWTAEGLTRLGMAYQQMEYYKQSADEVAKKMAEVEEQYKKKEITEKKYYETMQELESQQWDAINSYEDMKDAIIDLNEARIDMIEEGIEKEIEAYQELIDLKKEELDAERDLYDFKKDVEKQTKDIAALERRIASMGGSTDASTIAERTKLEAELREAKDSLGSSYTDHAYDSMSNALDDEMEAYEKSTNDYLESLRESIKDTDLLIEQTFIDVMQDGQTVLETLTKLSNEYGIQLDDYLTAPWKNSTTESLNFETYAISHFNAVYTAVETKTSTLTEYVKAPWEAGEGQAKAFSENVQKYMSEGVVDWAENNYKEQLKDTLNYPWDQANGYASWGDGVTTVLNEKLKEAQEVGRKINESLQVDTPSYVGNGTGDTNSTYNPGNEGSKYKTGENVKALQRVLNNVFGANLKEDGSYGPATKKAVENAQKLLQTTPYAISVRPAVNGEYDKKTKDAMSSYIEKKVDGMKKSFAGSSMIGQGIKELFSWKNVLPAAMYAKGTMGTKSSGFAITDESWIGEEITLAAGKNGQLQYLKKGSAVMPADISANLVEWGKINPDMINMPNTAQGINIISNAVNKPEVKFDIESFLHIDNVSHDTLPELKKFVNEQLEKFTKQMNYGLRRIGAT